MQEETSRRYKEYMTELLDTVFDDSAGQAYEVTLDTVEDVYLHDYRSEIIRIARNGQWIFVDSTGKRINDEGYDLVGYFHEGIVCVKKNGKWFYIDETGKRINNEEYDLTGDFCEGIAAVEKDGKWFYINRTGKRINNEEYDQAHNFHEGIARVKKNGKYFYINKAGERIDDKEYDLAGDFCEGMAKIGKDGKWFYIDLTGKRINNEEYDLAGDFCEGIAKVASNGNWFIKWFFIDKTGKRINSEKYEEAQNFTGGVALVKKNGTWFFIDKTGKRIDKEEYYEIQRFNDWIYGAKKNDIPVCLNKYGRIIFRGKYDRCECMANELGSVIAIKIVKDNKCNVFDYESGKMLLQNWYDEISLVKDHKRRVIPGYFLTQSFGFDPQLQIVQGEKIESLVIAGKLLITNNLIIVNNIVKPRKNEMKDYRISRNLTGLTCNSSTDSFKIKYQPIKCYGTKYVLCVYNRQMYLYDRDNNKYTPLGDCTKIEYDDNFIVDGNNKKIYLIYEGNLIDITEYYLEHLMGKEEIHITKGIKGFMSEQEFFTNNFTDIDEIIKASRQKRKEEEKKKEALREAEEEKKKIEEMKTEEARIEEKKEAIRKKKAGALKTLEAILLSLDEVEKEEQEISPESKSYRRFNIEKIFIKENDHLIINPDYVKMLKHIDLKNISFTNVKVSGVDFRGCNLGSMFDPQKVYQKDLHGCNFEGIYLPPIMNFTGVDISGCHFSKDNDSATIDYFHKSFENAIYDEETTYNGISFVKIIGPCKATSRSGEGRK